MTGNRKRSRLCRFWVLFAAAAVLSAGPAAASRATEPSRPVIWALEREPGWNRLTLEADGSPLSGPFWITKQGELMLPETAVRRQLGISLLQYPDGRIRLQQGNQQAWLREQEAVLLAGLQEYPLREAPRRKEDTLYLPLEALEKAFGWRREEVPGSGRVRLVPADPLAQNRLPDRYDYRDVGRAPVVRDQGEYGTCWSFASLSALESAMRPAADPTYSADHMTLQNGFSLEPDQGGDYTMAMAYLLSWTGPVPEEADPYGDGFSPEGLEAAVCVQGIRLLPADDRRAVKEAVFLEGGVQSSLYTLQEYGDEASPYYSEEHSAYCCPEEETPNHDVVIVGWDDHYPKENFPQEPEGDGAFLCVNSWGESFGEDGFFYVSYYDSCIGENGLVYTDIRPAGWCGRIYQSDLCGWAGQAGYGLPEVYAAVRWQAEEAEVLKAAGFYAVGADTSYELYVITGDAGLPEGIEDLRPASAGILPDAGYYTIDLEAPETLEAGETFTVLLQLHTPGEAYPLAVEYRADEVTAQAVIGDGEGYISGDGSRWESAEDAYGCDICLKVYTDPREAEPDRKE